MPRHNILYLVEYDKPDFIKTDNRIIILYDESDETYYCYGTRRRSKHDSPNNHRFIDYQVSFHSDKITTLVKWLSLLNNNFNSVYTVEMHQLTIEDDAYSTIDFSVLKSTMNRYTELFAYDKIKETEGSILEKLDMLQGVTNA